MEWEIPSFEQRLTWLNLSPIFPLGEIAKCRRVNSLNSLSEESKEDGDNGLEEPVEVEEDYNSRVVESRQPKTSSCNAGWPCQITRHSPNGSRKKADFCLSFLQKAFTPENDIELSRHLIAEEKLKN